MQKSEGYMTVASRILVQIFLMIFLGRPESVQRQYFNGQSLSGFGRFFIPYLFYDRQERAVIIIDAGPVLDTAVTSLTVQRKRINGHKIVVQELFQG